MTKPTFSIVTCTWNSAATLADTLASVQRQTWPEVEHIFVDGGSTDATLEMIAAYPGRKRVLRDIKGGISCAMNQGIEAASGDYVAHLHSDDYYASDDVLASVAERFASERVDWVVGTVQVLRDGQLIPPYKVLPFTYRSFAAGRAWVAHPAVFIRRSVFGRVGMFDEGLKYAMDVDLWLRLGRIARPATLDRALTVFRDHAGSVSSANKVKARQEEFQVRKRYLGKAPLAFGIYCLRYLKRMRVLRVEASKSV
jgi:glycosyltransferase involved in cell wall biosynthesis